MMQPLVSVLFITYNHKNFVEKALQSILTQTTTFPFEIVIADDGSKDGTREYLVEMAKTHPAKIRMSSPESNIGPAKNFIQLLNAGVAGGAKYIAYLEGDDYWTDTQKLQKQVDFLEKNPEVAICSHTNYEIRNGKLIVMDRRRNKKKQLFRVEDYLLDPFFHISSMVFRSANVMLPEWYEKVSAGDNFLILLLGLHGKIYFFPEPMSAYRVHYNSISYKFDIDDIKNNYFHYLNEFDILTKGKYKREINLVSRKWELNTKWRDKNYWRKLKYFFSNFIFYCRNLNHFTEIKLFFRYLIPTSILKYCMFNPSQYFKTDEVKKVNTSATT